MCFIRNTKVNETNKRAMDNTEDIDDKVIMNRNRQIAKRWKMCYLGLALDGARPQALFVKAKSSIAMSPR